MPLIGSVSHQLMSEERSKELKLLVLETSKKIKALKCKMLIAEVTHAHNIYMRLLP